MKPINYIEAKVPTWAMPYIFSNDAFDISDDQQNQINGWLYKTTKWLQLACPGAKVEIHDTGQRKCFCRRPAFGPSGVVSKIALVAWATNDDARGEMCLPWQN